MGKQGIALKNESEIPLVDRNSGVIFPAEHESPVLGGQKSRDQPQGRRFAATAGAEQRDQLAFFDRQVKVFQDELVIVCNRYMLQG